MLTTLRQRYVAVVAIAMLLAGSITAIKADKIIDARQYSGPCYNETVYRTTGAVYIYSSDYCGGGYDGPYLSYDTFGVQVCPNDYFEYIDYSDPYTEFFNWSDWTCGYQTYGAVYQYEFS